MYEDPAAPDEEPSSAQPDPELEQAVLGATRTRTQSAIELGERDSHPGRVGHVFCRGPRRRRLEFALDHHSRLVLPRAGPLCDHAVLRLPQFEDVLHPLFGAAVSGKHYNVQGWKKTLVALMGPLPGIVLGAGLGIAGLMLRKPILGDIAMPMLVLNGFNLLPLMPFDGGWVLARDPLLPASAFGSCLSARDHRGACWLGMIGGTIFFWIAGFMALTTPGAGASRTSRIGCASATRSRRPSTTRFRRRRCASSSRSCWPASRTKPPLTSLPNRSQRLRNAQCPAARHRRVVWLARASWGSFCDAVVMAIMLAVGQRMMAEEMKSECLPNATSPGETPMAANRVAAVTLSRRCHSAKNAKDTSQIANSD